MSTVFDRRNADSAVSFTLLMNDDFVRGNLLAVDTFRIIYTLHLETERLEYIVGNDLREYAEGVGRNASFNLIKSMITSPVKYPNNLWIVDSKDGCIRTLNRQNNATQHFTGKCGIIEDVQGEFKIAKTGEILDIIKHPHRENEYYFYDLTHYSLKSVILDSFSIWRVKKMYTFPPQDNQFARSILHMNYDFNNEFIHFTNKTSVWRYHPTTGERDKLIDSSQEAVDSGSINATIRYSFDSLFLSDTLFLISNDPPRDGGSTLQAIDLQARRVKSVCVYVPGYTDPRSYKRAPACGLKLIEKIFKHPTKDLILFPSGSIYALSYAGKKSYDCLSYIFNLQNMV